MALSLNDISPMDCLHVAIDWQERFAPGMGAFAQPMAAKTAAFAAQLREIGVPTLWVIYPQTKTEPPAVMRAGEAKARFDDLNKPYLAADNDWVATKYEESAFLNPALPAFVRRELARKTLLISGAFREECIDKSLTTGLSHTSFSFVVLRDLIVPGANGRCRDERALIDDNRAFFKKKFSSGVYDNARVVSQAAPDVVRALATAQEKRPSLSKRPSSLFSCKPA